MFSEYLDNKIKDYFGDILEYESRLENSKLYITLKTSAVWDVKSAMAYQTIILYRNPVAYGMPLDFKCEKIYEDIFIVTWNCYNVSD